MFQTEDYARAVNRWAHRRDPLLSDKHVQLRIARQKLLRREDEENGPLAVWSIIGEAALRTIAGSRAIMIAQLRHIRAVAEELSHVTFQVLAFEAGHGPLGSGQVTVLRHPLAPTDMVYLEGPDGPGRILDREEHIQHTLWAFEQTRALAESEDRSLTLLNQQIETFEEMPE